MARVNVEEANLTGVEYLRKQGVIISDQGMKLCNRCEENYKFVKSLLKDLKLAPEVGISEEGQIALDDELDIYMTGMGFVKEDALKYFTNQQSLDICREHYRRRMEYIDKVKEEI